MNRINVLKYDRADAYTAAVEKPPRERAVKTTVVLPEHLWRAAKIRAMDDREDLRTVLIKALERYLGAASAKAPAGTRPAGRGTT